jgi:hypothetical protein
MYTFLGFLVLAPATFFLVTIILFDILKKIWKPKLNRKWDNLDKLLPSISLNEKSGEMFVKNIRNARYNPVFEFEYKVEYLSKKYNLSDLCKLWVIKNNLGFSFQFGADLHSASFLTVFYEVRKVDAVNFSLPQVLYKFFEGYYLLATEQDAFFVRTNIRSDGNKNLIYEIEMNKEKLQKIFLEFVKKINQYEQHAYEYKFYKRSLLSEVFRNLKKNESVQIKKYRIKNTNNLKADEHYSLRLRSQLERVG